MPLLQLLSCVKSDSSHQRTLVIRDQSTGMMGFSGRLFAMGAVIASMQRLLDQAQKVYRKKLRATRRYSWIRDCLVYIEKKNCALERCVRLH